MIDFKSTQAKTVMVFDALGKLVVQKETEDAFINIDLRSNATGVYFVKVYTENKLLVGKLIKQE